MIKNLFGIKENDLKKIREGLEQLKALNDDLSAKYSLRADLRDLTDNRYTVRALLQEELDKISSHQEDLINKTAELTTLKLQLDESLEAIEKIQALIKKDEEGNSAYLNLLELIDEDKLDVLESKSDEVHQLYSHLFDRSGEDTSRAERIDYEVKKISDHYERFFSELTNNETRVSEYERKVNELFSYYDDLFSSDESDSKSDKINSQLAKIQKFYEKIYGDEGKNIPSLNDALENRLENLRNIEDKAKSVIGLSSEAGLAGGFVIKGKEAKKGQLISITVFIVMVLILFGFNLYFFDKADFLNMTWDTFLFKLLINAPLIWIATIANINLNRFSRLEQEYSHKEALAKSYERYKTEIQELEKLGIEGSGELKLKLLEINLEAFKVNPAENSDKAKPDFSLWDSLQRKSKTSADE